jgi:hypothetical protein
MRIPLKTAGLIVALALLAGILYYIALLPQKPSSQEGDNQSNLASTTLSIDSTQKSSSEKYFSDILINTNGNLVTSVQLELVYDPEILEDVSIEAGAFFDSPTEFIEKIVSEEGRITYVIGLPTSSTGIAGKGSVARVYYSPVNPEAETVTAITFLPKTDVKASNFSGSALSGTFDGLVNISAVTPTRNPSPTFVPFTPTPTIEVPPQQQ